MTVAELITQLTRIPPGHQIMILDGFNGGGRPREINLGPSERTITTADVNDCGDCEDLGQDVEVYVLGYGCY